MVRQTRVVAAAGAFGVLVLLAGAGRPATERGVQTQEAVPVIVELFTSEGCSSCPPADDLLRRLTETQPIEGVTIIPLSLHVDYWDYIGWKDPFSDAAWGRRQSAYAKALGESGRYTPQMVVDGISGFVGSDEIAARTAIGKAARRRDIPVDLTLDEPASGTLRIRVEASPGSRPMNVMVAITEDGLVTDVPRGENGGRRLRHDGVVRKLVSIGRITTGPGVTMPLETTVALAPSWERDRLHVVAFLQDVRGMEILGAATTTLKKMRVLEHTSGDKPQDTDPG